MEISIEEKVLQASYAVAIMIFAMMVLALIFENFSCGAGIEFWIRVIVSVGLLGVGLFWFKYGLSFGCLGAALAGFVYVALQYWSTHASWLFVVALMMLCVIAYALYRVLRFERN